MKPNLRRKIIVFKPPTALSLANAAAEYLAKFSASKASLKRVLHNRLRRAAMRIPDFAADNAAQETMKREIDNIITRHKNSGMLNDEAYAETKVNSLRRAGRSRRFIEQKLGQNGVKGDVVRGAIQKSDDGRQTTDYSDAELEAATTYARKRRLGTFRTAKPTDDDRAKKDLSALARVGFSLDIARRALRGA